MTNDNEVILDIKVKYDDAIKGIVKYRKEIEELKETNKDLEKGNKENNKQNKERETIYKKGKVSVSEFTGDTKKSSRSIAENTAQIEANNIEIQRKSAAIRILQNEIKDNIKLETEQKKSINAITAELRLLNRQYEKLGEGIERDALGAKIKLLQGDLNGLNEARSRFQAHVGDYESAIKNALGLNNQFANSIMNLATSSSTGEQSIKSFFSNAGTSVKAFGSSLMALMTNPVFLAIAGIVGVGIAFKFWYDYNKGLEEATKLTKQFTGLSGNELKAYRNEIQGVSDTYGKDFKEVLEASNAVAKQFGITQQEALQYIKDGFIAGADASGEYLNILKEYPASFKEAGISASEFIAITAETANQGIFSSKGIDAIKEANIRLREMNTSTASALNGIGISSKEVQKSLQDGSTTTFDVMQKVSEKLNEYPEQSKQVGAAIADIFGGAGEDAGLQYLKTLKDIDTNLDSTKEKAGQLGEIQERQMNANIELQNVISGLFDQTGGTFETMIGNAKVFATESITSIIKGLVDIINYGIKLYNDSMLFRGVIAGLIAWWKTLYDVLVGVFTYVIDTAKIVGKALYSALTFDVGGVIDAYEEWGKNTMDIVKDIADSAVDNAKEAIDKIQNDKIDPIELPVNVVTTSEGTDTEPKGGKMGLTDEMKKAIEAEKKAAVELAKFRLETEIKNQKDLADNQEKSYDDRLKALNTYVNLQKAFIEKDKEYQLSQKGLTESQIALIKEKSNQKQIELQKELTDKSLQIIKDHETKQKDVLNTNIQNKLAVIKQGSDEELSLRLQQLALQEQAEIASAEKTGADIALIREKYRQLDIQEQEKQDAYLSSQRQKEFQNKILEAQLEGQNTLAIQLEQKTAQLEALNQLEGESDLDYYNRKLQLQNELKNIEDDYLNYQLETRIQVMQATATIAGGFQELFESMAEDNAAFAGFAKAMALYQIGVDTATALTAGVKQAQSVPFPGNIAAIATTVATILSNIAKAKKYLTASKEPKAPSFNQGGLVTGEGSGTSDSIRAYLSNGESVMTARTTAMFSPILSAFNQIGGGVPISTQDTSNQVMGEEMLSRAFAKAVLNIPNPAVSVQEIDNVNNRIGVLEKSRSL